mgnify:CR=1 FL=1
MARLRPYICPAAIAYIAALIPMLQWLRERWRPRAPAPADVRLRIESNRLHLRDLEKRLEHLNKRALAERQQANELHQSSRRASALFHLRRAKMYESQEQALQGQMLNLDEATARLEQSALTAETFTGLKQGAIALQDLHKELDTDRIDDAMDSIQEQYAVQSELTDAISAPTSVMDDDELLQELIGPEAPAPVAVAPVAPAPPPTLVDLPEAPVADGPPRSPPGAPVELRDLEASMCI